jgi:hypothetical protein
MHLYIYMLFILRHWGSNSGPHAFIINIIIVHGRHRTVMMCIKVIKLSFWVFCLSVCLVVLGFELRTLRLPGRCFTT